MQQGYEKKLLIHSPSSGGLIMLNFITDFSSCRVDDDIQWQSTDGEFYSGVVSEVIKKTDETASLRLKNIQPLRNGSCPPSGELSEVAILLTPTTQQSIYDMPNCKKLHGSSTYIPVLVQGLKKVISANDRRAAWESFLNEQPHAKEFLVNNAIHQQQIADCGQSFDSPESFREWYVDHAHVVRAQIEKEFQDLDTKFLSGVVDFLENFDSAPACCLGKLLESKAQEFKCRLGESFLLDLPEVILRLISDQSTYGLSDFAKKREMRYWAERVSLIEPVCCITL